MSKNLSVSLRVQLQGAATKELTQQLKALRGEMLAVSNVSTKLNGEVLKLAAGFKLAVAEGKGLTSTLAQLTGQSTLLGGRSRTLAGDVNLVGRSLQNGARDAERMRRELERLRGVNPPRPLPPNGGGSGNAPPHQGTNAVLNTGAVALATGVAAYITSKDKVNDSINYSSQLMSMSNTAYYDRDLTGRIYGKHELANATLNAIRQGGGSRDQASEALNMLIASGNYTPQEANSLLPTLQMAVTGTRASSTDLARIGTKGGLFGFKNTKEDLLKMIDMGNLSGKQGGFELQDMAPWLSRQMGAASTSGMRGERDFALLLSANQIAMKVAGTSDEAGNNVQNLLFKLNGQDTSQDFKKMGVNLRGWLANVQLKGKNPLVAYTELIQSQLEKDPSYATLQKELLLSKNDEERKDKLDRAATVLQGGVVGTIFQDREALKAMIALINMKDTWLKQAEIVETQYKDTTKKDFEANSQEADFKIQAFKNEWQAAADRVFTPVGNLLADVANSTATSLKANEAFGNALVVTTSSLLVLAAGATAASMVFGKSAVISTLTGGALGAGLISIVAGVGKMAVPALVAAGVAGITAVVGGVLASALAGYGIGTGIESVMNKGEGTWHDSIGGSVAWFLGHGFGNDEALNAIREREKQDEEKKRKQKVEESEMLATFGATPQFKVNNIIMLDSQQIASSVETQITRQAQRQ